MVRKKSPKADLENKRSIFFEVGLALTMFLVLMAFEWKTTQTSEIGTYITQHGTIETELPPVTTDNIKQPAAPKVIVSVDKITVVDKILSPKSDENIFNEILPSEGYTIGKILPAETEVDEPYINVQVMPKFGNGNLDDFRLKYILKNIQYPDEALKNNLTGWVYVEFVVERDGSVSNVNVIKGIDPLLDQEAIRVIKKSPKWTPGLQDNKPVRVKYVVPIQFLIK